MVDAAVSNESSGVRGLFRVTFSRVALFRDDFREARGVRAGEKSDETCSADMVSAVAGMGLFKYITPVLEPLPTSVVWCFRGVLGAGSRWMLSFLGPLCRGFLANLIQPPGLTPVPFLPCVQQEARARRVASARMALPFSDCASYVVVVPELIRISTPVVITSWFGSRCARGQYGSIGLLFRDFLIGVSCFRLFTRLATSALWAGCKKCRARERSYG